MVIKNEPFLFTSESVTEGHPDKMADQISDAVLDACFTEDPNSRVACETSVSTGLALLTGEITTEAEVDYSQVVRDTVADIGYTNSKFGFDAETSSVMVAVDKQSEDIAQGVDTGGAGDQGLMFGYACNETDELMPAPIMLSHRLTKGLARLRKEKEVEFLRPDGKSQVTVRYEDEVPVEVTTAVVSSQHHPDVSQAEIKSVLEEKLIRDVIPDSLFTDDLEIYVNPTGRFVRGGPYGDAGLTGRKIIVDTYGGAALHGGGAFSGKDPSKVDRSAAYAARYLAKNVVAAGMAERCTIQLSYAIGVARPLSIYAETHGTGEVDPVAIERAIAQVMDLTPRGIREHLGLNRPIYARTAAYGHFGREPDADGGFSWEKTDLVEALKRAV